MKNIYLLLFVAFYGCAEMQVPSNSKVEKTENKINEQCQTSIEEVEIFQVFENGALANVCEHGSRNCYGMVVAVPKEKDEALWDKKRIKAPKDKCIVINDTYKYTSKNGMDRTVPIIRFDYKYLPKDREEAIERIESSLAPLYDKCLVELVKANKSDKAANKELCGCYVDSMKNLVIDIGSNSEKVDQNLFLERWIVESEKDCGKSPKSMNWFK